MSAAYYALFHTVVKNAVEHLLPGAEEEQLRLARSFAHGSISDVCQWITGLKNPSGAAKFRPIVDRLRDNSSLADVANAFVELQERRHQADYDHLAGFTRPEVLADIDAARAAIKAIRGLRHTPDGKTFFVLVAMRKGLS